MSLSFWIRDYVFLPLATMRREIWWRNLALVISMAAFGVWHGASVLFLVWGVYHGVLLVLHRMVQKLQRRWSWEPGRLGTALGWIATITLVNLGWIFFRADSQAEAVEMLKALVSPGSYKEHFLSASLYILVASIGVGYALALRMIDAVESHGGETASGIVALVARWRWYWLPPLYGLAMVFLLIVTLTGGATAAQFMYNKF